MDISAADGSCRVLTTDIEFTPLLVIALCRGTPGSKIVRPGNPASALLGPRQRQWIWIAGIQLTDPAYGGLRRLISTYLEAGVSADVALASGKARN